MRRSLPSCAGYGLTFGQRIAAISSFALPRFAGLYTSAYDDYLSNLGQKGFAGLDRGDAKIQQAAVILLSLRQKAADLNMRWPGREARL